MPPRFSPKGGRTGRLYRHDGWGSPPIRRMEHLPVIATFSTDTGTLPLYGCKRQCAVCEGVFKKAIPRLKSRSRYLNCTAHDDRTVEHYQQQAHPSNIKALDVDKYFPA